MMAWFFPFVFPHFCGVFRCPKGGGEVLISLVAGGHVWDCKEGVLVAVF